MNLAIDQPLLIAQTDAKSGRHVPSQLHAVFTHRERAPIDRSTGPLGLPVNHPGGVEPPAGAMSFQTNGPVCGGCGPARRLDAVLRQVEREESGRASAGFELELAGRAIGGCGHFGGEGQFRNDTNRTGVFSGNHRLAQKQAVLAPRQKELSFKLKVRAERQFELEVAAVFVAVPAAPVPLASERDGFAIDLQRSSPFPFKDRNTGRIERELRPGTGVVDFEAIEARRPRFEEYCGFGGLAMCRFGGAGLFARLHRRRLSTGWGQSRHHLFGAHAVQSQGSGRQF